jgi:hypothetical protein
VNLVNIPYYDGYAIAQLVEALHYKQEGLCLDSRWSLEIFHSLNPSDRTVALGSIQPVTEMGNRDLPRGNG